MFTNKRMATKQLCEDAGGVLVIFLFAMFGILGMFALSFESFMAIRSSLQLRTDVRSTAYAQAVADLKSNSTTNSANFYGNTVSSRYLGGVITNYTGFPNWTIRGDGMVHQLTGLQIFIPGSENIGQFEMERESRVDYDDRVTQLGFCPIFITH